MNCHDVQSSLNDYLDTELESSIRKEINDHLLTCDSCRAELQTLRDIHQAVKQQADINLKFQSEAFAQALKARIKEEGLREHRPVTNFYGRIAIVMLVILLIIMLMGGARYVSFISSFKPYKAALAEEYFDTNFEPATFKYPVSNDYQPLFSYPIQNQRASEWLSDLITSYSKGELTYDLLYPILEQSDILDNASIVYKFDKFSATEPRPAPILLLRHRLPQRFILKFPRSILIKNWDKLSKGIRSKYRGFTDAPIITTIGLNTIDSDEVYILFFTP